MIDQKLIIENPKLVAGKLAKKGCIVDFKPFLELDEKRHALILSVEELMRKVYFFQLLQPQH